MRRSVTFPAAPHRAYVAFKLIANVRLGDGTAIRSTVGVRVSRVTFLEPVSCYHAARPGIDAVGLQ